ncbi:Protein NAP1 [Linum perenne]
MAKSHQQFTSRDSSMSPTAERSKDWEGPARWTEYLGPDMTSPVVSRSSRFKGSDGHHQGSGASHKGLNLQWVVQLTEVAEGLMSKMYRLNQILDFPDPISHSFSEGFWKAGIFPNHPRMCTLLSKKFPDHFSKLQLERMQVDKSALDSLNDSAEVHLQSLDPWIQMLLDLMAFREQALRLILDLSSTVITLLPHQNSLILHAFMDLFCSFVRVNLFSEKIPRKMMLQVYNLLHAISRNDRDCDFYHRLVQFIDSYDPPLKGLQEDLNFVSPRIGEVLEAVGPIIFLSTDTKKLRNEGFLSPYHPRYPDILTNSAHPMRAQDLANVTSYREWVLLGYLVCPDELLRVTSIDIAQVVLKENLILTVFRDEYVLLHEDYQLYVLPRVLESKKMAKSGRSKQKEADLEYSVAKQVEKMISEVHDQALLSCDVIHRERRILLKQEIGRMVMFFTDQPSLLAPNIQMVFSALALAQSEVIWYFQHVGIASSKSKAARTVAVDLDPSDPTIGYLLDGMDRLCCLVRKYIAAIRGYALSYLSSCAGRIRFLLGTPGMVALDLDATLKGLFQHIVHHLEKLPKAQGENSIACDLSEFRKDWLSILMIVTSARSSINIRHLEKATVSTGKEGLLSEGNAAYNWSRCVDELESQLSKHGSLKKLYFYHQHYMRECILGNFRRRLLTVLKTDNDLQRPSVLESLIRRHMSIIHLAEHHISMDLTHGMREALLTEAFCGPVSSLHLFEKPAEELTGSATEIVCNWYIENIVKDVSGAGILFTPKHECFKSTRPVGGYFAESVTDLRELQAFVHIFGGYGIDRLDRLMKEHTAALLNCIDTSLRSNRELLESVAGSMHSGDRIEREASSKQILDLDTVIGFCIEAGQALAFDELLAEAAGLVLKEGAPLIHSLVTGVIKHIPEEIPEKKEIRRIRGVANSVGIGGDHDSEWVRSILDEVGGANDASWTLLPYLFATFMTSNIWYTTGFNVDTGGFNNNIHCLARCISAVIAGSEYVKLEREHRQRHSLSNGHSVEAMDSEMHSHLSAEASIKSAMQIFIKFSAGIVLDSWSDDNRSHLVAKLIFLDQLCEISPYLPRSSLEAYVPYAILRSIYCQYYSNSPSMPLALLNTASPRHSPAVPSGHASPSQEHIYETESGSVRSRNSDKPRNVRRSGPLDYSSSRKVKHMEGSSGSGSTGPSPLPRFAVSRSGPLMYK